ncbi:MAG: cupin domain-containing protein [Flavobacteriales bacterium]|nr:cupin domain-containing protein [Flavobacteriales bacterium]
MNTPMRNPITGQELEILRGGEDTGGELLVMRSTLRPGSLPPSPHFHPAQREDFRVEQGEITVRMEGASRVYRKGETLHIPAGVVHNMWNAGREVAVVHWETRPALRTEAFLRNAFGLAADGKCTAQGTPTLPQASLLLPRFAAEYRLASPPVWVQRIVFAVLAPLARLRGLKPEYPAYAGGTRARST